MTHITQRRYLRSLYASRSRILQYTNRRWRHHTSAIFIVTQRRTVIVVEGRSIVQVPVQRRRRRGFSCAKLLLHVKQSHFRAKCSKLTEESSLSSCCRSTTVSTLLLSVSLGRKLANVLLLYDASAVSVSLSSGSDELSFSAVLVGTCRVHSEVA